MARNKQTLVQRIAMEGGDAIRRELEALGKDGAAAFAALKKAADEVAKADTGLSGMFRRVKKEFKDMKAGADDVRKGFGQMATSLRSSAIAIGAVTAAASGAIFGLYKMVQSATEAGDKIADTADMLGVTVEALQELRYAAEMGGMGIQNFDIALRRFIRRGAEAAKGTGAAKGAFAELGITLVDGQGKMRDSAELLREVADAMARVPSQADRLRLAFQMFDTDGALMVNVLKDGSAGLAEMAARARELGIVITEPQARMSAAFRDAFEDAQRAAAGLSREIAFLFTPAFTTMAESFTAAVVENRNALIDLARQIADLVLPLFNDLMALLRGDDGGVSNKALLGIRDTVVNLANAFNTLYTVVALVFRSIANAIQPVLDLFNLVFGTDLRADVALLVLALTHFLGVFRIIGGVAGGLRVVFAGLVKIFGTATAQIAGVAAAALGLQGALKTLVDIVFEAFGSMLKPIQDFIDLIGKAINEFLRWIGLKEKNGGSGGGDPAPAFARGGHVRGPGTGTSDSILARLSNGEFVVRAAAVRKYGTAFLRALNEGKLPGFNMGGLVNGLTPRAPLPAFADGGLASAGGGVSGRPLSLTIGGETFSGLIAPDDVADKLARYATGRSLRRAGRVPTWYGGKA